MYVYAAAAAAAYLLHPQSSVSMYLLAVASSMADLFIQGQTH